MANDVTKNIFKLPEKLVGDIEKTVESFHNDFELGQNSEELFSREDGEKMLLSTFKSYAELYSLTEAITAEGFKPAFIEELLHECLQDGGFSSLSFESDDLRELYEQSRQYNKSAYKHNDINLQDTVYVDVEVSISELDQYSLEQAHGAKELKDGFSETKNVSFGYGLTKMACAFGHAISSGFRKIFNREGDSIAQNNIREESMDELFDGLGKKLIREHAWEQIPSSGGIKTFENSTSYLQMRQAIDSQKNLITGAEMVGRLPDETIGNTALTLRKQIIHLIFSKAIEFCTEKGYTEQAKMLNHMKSDFAKTSITQNKTSVCAEDVLKYTNELCSDLNFKCATKEVKKQFVYDLTDNEIKQMFTLKADNILEELKALRSEARAKNPKASENLEEYIHSIPLLPTIEDTSEVQLKMLKTIAVIGKEVEALRSPMVDIEGTAPIQHISQYLDKGNDAQIQLEKFAKIMQTEEKYGFPMKIISNSTYEAFAITGLSRTFTNPANHEDVRKSPVVANIMPVYDNAGKITQYYYEFCSADNALSQPKSNLAAINQSYDCTAAKDDWAAHQENPALRPFAFGYCEPADLCDTLAAACKNENSVFEYNDDNINGNNQPVATNLNECYFKYLNDGDYITQIGRAAANLIPANGIMTTAILAEGQITSEITKLQTGKLLVKFNYEGIGDFQNVPIGAVLVEDAQDIPELLNRVNSGEFSFAIKRELTADEQSKYELAINNELPEDEQRIFDEEGKIDGIKINADGHTTNLMNDACIEALENQGIDAMKISVADFLPTMTQESSDRLNSVVYIVEQLKDVNTSRDAASMAPVELIATEYHSLDIDLAGQDSLSISFIEQCKKNGDSFLQLKDGSAVRVPMNPTESELKAIAYMRETGERPIISIDVQDSLTGASACLYASNTRLEDSMGQLMQIIDSAEGFNEKIQLVSEMSKQLQGVNIPNLSAIVSSSIGQIGGDGTALVKINNQVQEISTALETGKLNPRDLMTVYTHAMENPRETIKVQDIIKQHESEGHYKESYVNPDAKKLKRQLEAKNYDGFDGR